MLRDLLNASSLFLIGGLLVSGCGSSDSSGLTATGGSSNTGGAAGSAGTSGSGGSAGSGLGGSGAQGATAGGGAGGSGAGGAGAGGAGAGGSGAASSGGVGAGGAGAGGSAGAFAGGSAGLGAAGAGAAGSGGTAGSTWTGPGQIGCGSDSCGLNQSEFCCLAQGTAPACVTKSNQCKCTGILCQAIELRCDGTEDCPGKICCLEKAIAQTPKVTCEASCDSAITVDRKEVCKIGHPSTCTKGGTCKQVPELPPGIGSCQ